MLHSTALRALSLVLLSLGAHAQVEHGGRPLSAARALRKPLSTARMSPVRSDRLLAEDALAPGKGALRFAEILPVELGLRNAGVWEELGRGDRLWRLRIHSPGAKSLALVFARYRLPPGGELFVYDDARKVVRGAYTELENRLDGQFAIRPLRGEAATLEYFEPASARGQGELVLASVAHDYRDVLSLIDPENRNGGGGSSDVCEIDVTCTLGNPWSDQIDSAVHIQSLASGFLCSGALLNNTANDGTVLVLTASHCGTLTNAIFTFNFQRPGCATGVAPCTDTILGATELVRDDSLDVQLLRLDVPQGPLAFPAHLAGWDRTDVAPSALFLIHHPRGDSKKISRSNNAPLKQGNFWNVQIWNRGVSEPGSSGAPAFASGLGLFIGILDSGGSTCGAPFNDFVTRLASAWTRLEPYLDPLGTGALTTTGLDLAAVTPVPFEVTGVFPAVVETLDPRPDRTLRILGSGFSDATDVALDGIPLDRARYLRGGHSFLNLDLPPLRAGAHTFAVQEGGVTKTIPFDVVAPSVPRMQVAHGIPNELVFSPSVDTFHADLPGHVHCCFWSLSNIPSTSRLLTLGLGNGFTDLRGCLVRTIPPDGFVKVAHTIPPSHLPFGTIVYNQSACLSHGRPLPASNLQQTTYQF